MAKETEKTKLESSDKVAWQKWADENTDLFDGTGTDARIGVVVSQPGNEGQIIILEKQNRRVIANPKSLEEIERVCDILFMMGEETASKLVNGSGVTLETLIFQGKVGIQALRSQWEILDKGYDGLLGRLGLRFGGGCCG